MAHDCHTSGDIYGLFDAFDDWKPSFYCVWNMDLKMAEAVLIWWHFDMYEWSSR